MAGWRVVCVVGGVLRCCQRRGRTGVRATGSGGVWSRSCQPRSRTSGWCETGPGHTRDRAAVDAGGCRRASPGPSPSAPLPPLARPRTPLDHNRQPQHRPHLHKPHRKPAPYPTATRPPHHRTLDPTQAHSDDRGEDSAPSVPRYFRDEFLQIRVCPADTRDQADIGACFSHSGWSGAGAQGVPPPTRRGRDP